MEPLGRSCMHDLPLVKLFYIEYYREIWVRESLKVIETDTIQKIRCGFLFGFYSNYGAIWYCL